MTRRPVHPWIFMVLILPFGVMSGYLTVAIAYLLKQAGVSTEQIAGLIAVSFIPHTWKFLWAPVADTTLGRKHWYVIASVLSAVGIWATGALPATPRGLTALAVVVVIANVAVTFLGMSVESLMAYEATEEEKGRASGWFQAGNLGGGGVGGGLGLWLSVKLPEPWMAGGVLAVVCLLCCVPLLFIEEPMASHRKETLGKSLVHVAGDLWNTAKSRIGLIALILCFLPIGSGAAGGLWSTVAGDWNASLDTVEFVNGTVAGLISAAGCVAGGWFCDRMNRQAAYAIYGVFQATCAVAMALAPRTESNYIVFTLLYAFITGLTYAGFSAFVLEAMGLGAAATKYSLFASLSNMPIAYMTVIDGWAYERWHARGMLFTEAAVGIAGLLLFIAILVLFPPRRQLTFVGMDHESTTTRK
jgi:MFS transporter, PAT family, beta-lactamase induction signal transducer AmpG